MGRKKSLKIETLQDFKRAALRGAWRGLRWQGFVPSRSADGGQCLYRGPEGRCCGVGWLCTDVTEDRGGVYSALPARRITLARPLADFIARVNTPDSAWAGDPVWVLAQIQYAHDEATNPRQMEGNLRRLAADWGVELPEVGQ